MRCCSLRCHNRHLLAAYWPDLSHVPMEHDISKTSLWSWQEKKARCYILHLYYGDIPPVQETLTCRLMWHSRWQSQRAKLRGHCSFQPVFYTEAWTPHRNTFVTVKCVNCQMFSELNTQGFSGPITTSPWGQDLTCHALGMTKEHPSTTQGLSLVHIPVIHGWQQNALWVAYRLMPGSCPSFPFVIRKLYLFVSRTVDSLIIDKLPFPQPPINSLSKKRLLLGTVMEGNLCLYLQPWLWKPAVVARGGYCSGRSPAKRKSLFSPS